MISHQLSHAELAVNDILRNASKLMKMKYSMLSIGTNVAMPSGHVKVLRLSFQIKGPCTQQRLREILVHGIQDFIQVVNNNKEIHKHLQQDPFCRGFKRLWNSSSEHWDRR